MRIILPVHGIEVELSDPAGAPVRSGTIRSDLKNRPPDHGPHGPGAGDDSEYDAVIDGLESLILAAALEGVDIQSLNFVRAVETAVEAIANKYGD